MSRAKQPTHNPHAAFATGWRDLPVGAARSRGRREVGVVGRRASSDFVGIYKALHTREARSLMEEH